MDLAQRINLALGTKPVDLLLKNGRLINVFAGSIHTASLAVHEGRIVGFGDYEAIETVDLQGRRITAVPANHTVPAVGYHLDSGEGSLVFSGDTYTNDSLWAAVNRIQNLRYLIMETAFSNGEKEIAFLSKHLCPSLLADELAKFTGDADVYITHLKPDEVELIMGEIASYSSDRDIKMLLNNQVFEF